MQPNIVFQFILPSRIRWYNMNGSKYISPRVLFRGMKYDQGIGLSNESNVRIIYIYYTFLYIVYVYIYILYVNVLVIRNPIRLHYNIGIWNPSIPNILLQNPILDQTYIDHTW